MSEKRMSEKDWKKHLKKIGMLEPPIIERKEGCNHTDLKKLIADEIVYQCQNPECGMIVNIVGSSLYTPQLFARNMMVMLRILVENDPKVKEVVDQIMATEYVNARNMQPNLEEKNEG